MGRLWRPQFDRHYHRDWGRDWQLAEGRRQRKVELTFPHLIPKKAHRRKRFKNNYSKKQLNAGIHVCRLCHRGIHRLYDELTLARDFNTLEQLVADEALAKHFAWVSKQKEQQDSPNWL